MIYITKFYKLSERNPFTCKTKTTEFYVNFDGSLIRRRESISGELGDYETTITDWVYYIPTNEEYEVKIVFINDNAREEVVRFTLRMWRGRTKGRRIFIEGDPDFHTRTVKAIFEPQFEDAIESIKLWINNTFDRIIYYWICKRDDNECKKEVEKELEKN